MNMDREYFYELVDKVPDAKLDELRRALLIMAIPIVEPTIEEIEAIKKGKEEFENGEFFSYDDVEALRKDLYND